MQISVLSLIISLAGAAFLNAQPQPANPELQSQALELLRKTISQDRQQPAEVVPRVTTQSTPSDLQQQAVQRLRESIQADAASVPSAATPPPTVRSKPAKVGPKQPRVQPAPEAVPPVAPAPAVEPAGPKTKQARLIELLEQYRADKMTPAEYHAQRAKILAEP